MQGGSPPFFSAPLRKINSNKFSRCARGKKKRKKAQKHTPKSTKTPKNTKKNTKKNTNSPPALTREKKATKKNLAYARKLTLRTKKIIHSPAPFKGAQERGIAALTHNSPTGTEKKSFRGALVLWMGGQSPRETRIWRRENRRRHTKPEEAEKSNAEEEKAEKT